MKTGMKTVVILLAILVCINTVMLYKINDRTEKTNTYVEHSNAFIAELINVLTGKVNGLVSAVNEENAATKDAGNIGKTMISGSFAATVRDLLPDYILDDTTPTVAIVSAYQDLPFALYIGKDLISQLEIGKTYEFFVEEKEIEITKDQYEAGSVAPNIAISIYDLRITSITPITEIGLDHNRLTYNDFVK